MKYKISKEKVKQAMIYENLSGQGWFNGGPVDDGECGVCAVGAVLRKTKPKHFSKYAGVQVTQGVFGREDFEYPEFENNFLSRLSVEYETAKNVEEEQSDSNDMRMFLLFLTEAFCPPVLEFEV